MIKVYTIPEFDKSLKRLSRKFPSLKVEYADFIEKTERENVQGLSLGNGFYKARLSVQSKGKGKSGGLRIISYKEVIYKLDETEIILVAIYDKSDLSSVDRRYLELLVTKYKTS